VAKNRVHETGNRLSLAATNPATPVSGDPVRVGQVPGVALTDERADGTTTIQTDGVFTLSVKGVDGSGNAAIAAGDIVYYVDADTPKLSVKTTGVRFGYALDAVSSGATTAIRVKVGY
jgi:predicted RecA/RadA family phage recombinase